MSEHVSIIEVPRTEHNNPIIVEKYSDGSSAIQQESNHYPHSSPTKYIPIEPVQLDPLIVALGGAAQARIATLTTELADLKQHLDRSDAGWEVATRGLESSGERIKKLTAELVAKDKEIAALKEDLTKNGLKPKCQECSGQGSYFHAGRGFDNCRACGGTGRKLN